MSRKSKYICEVDAPEQTKSLPRPVKVIKAGTNRPVPAESMGQNQSQQASKPTRTAEDIRNEWMKSKQDTAESNQFQSIRDFFFGVPSLEVS